MPRLIAPLLTGVLATSIAHAEEPSSPPPSTADEQARDLFARGAARYAVEDWDGALAFMQRSRALTASGSNTINAANCLKKLGRYDEALDLYEIALARFPTELSATNKTTIAPEMAELSRKVGVIELVGNVEGAEIAVDGRIRRDIPDVRRIRMLPGAHTLRLVRNGFTPSETRVVAEASRRLKVTPQLTPIGAWIRIDADGALTPGATVILDGGVVGSTPWEGPVRPGPHLVWATQENTGSLPARVSAVEGKITAVMLPGGELGAETRIEASPEAPAITIDDVEVAHGSWSGRLPVGSHRLVVTEPGYRTRTAPVLVARGESPVTLRVALIRDPQHARWPKTLPNVWWVSDFVGYALGSSLGSGPEGSCAATTCTGHWGAGGPFVGLRVGYELPFKLSFELTGGATRLRTGFTRAVVQHFGDVGEHAATFHLDDHLTMTGPFVGLGLSQRFAIGSRTSLIARLGVGALFVWARDPITGFLDGGGQRLPVKVFKANELLTSVDFFVLPEVGSSVRLGPFELGGFLAVGAFLGDGPAFDHHTIRQPTNSCEHASKDGAGCTIESPAVAGEHAYGRFVTFIPRIDVRYSFR